ncbi:MAG: hypothetical protein M3Y08_08660 [Fibrobacterota bacterium]|nr:hypothetical protein [Fibrobacterota bacterium]
MNKIALALTCGIGLLAAPLCAEDAPKIEYKPLSIAALHEFGQLKKGIYHIGSGSVGEVWTNDWIDHFGAFVTKEAIVNERLFLSGGLGGVFQFRKPELLSPDFTGSQRRNFFMGPTRAVAEYHFGDPTNPYLTLGSGMFMYKYNQDANDLGEYLYRSGAYPAYTVTGGYVLVNSAAANVQGAKASLNFGNFKADFLITTETNLAPFYDWSIGGIGSYSIADGLLDLGAGVNFKRLFPVKQTRTSRPTLTNSYFTLGGQDYTTKTDYYSHQVEFYNNKKNHVDSVKAAALKVLLDTVNAVISPSRMDNKPEILHYTNAGILLMGRASLDLKKIMSSDLFGPQDLKLYSEIAVLGLKNYPVFYTKVTERMPIMFGFNLPTFRWLDLLSVQGEVLKSPWLNNTAQIGNSASPTPALPQAFDRVASKNEWNDLATKDDWKWSILAKKKIGNYITISGQAANDHMRMVSSRYFYGPQYDHNEVTVSSDHWYWMTQVSWGI